MVCAWNQCSAMCPNRHIQCGKDTTTPESFEDINGSGETSNNNVLYQGYAGGGGDTMAD